MNKAPLQQYSRLELRSISLIHPHEFFVILEEKENRVRERKSRG
jgi:hypothetical protein